MEGCIVCTNGAHDVIKWPGDKAKSSGNEEMLQIKITKPINWTVACTRLFISPPPPPPP